MAGTVITDLQFFTGITAPNYPSNCDQTTDWSGGPTLDSVTFVQGSGALSAKVSKAVYESVFTLQNPVDLKTAWRVIYVWAMCSGRMDTHPGADGYGAGSGFRIRVYEGTNWGEWDVAGRNTWAGGWTCWAVHTSTAFSRNGGVDPDLQYTSKVGIVFETVGSATAVNCWWDALRFGTYIGVKGGTEGSPATLQNIMDQENDVNNKWGVFSEYEGLFIVQGKLILGSTTPQDNTYFKDLSERILLNPDRLFPSDFFEIRLQGNTAAPPTYFTKIYFGEKIGDSGVRGITARAVSSSKPFKVTASDTNITEYGFYGCTFYQAGSITLQPYSTVKEFLGCTVSKSGQVLPDTGIVKYCNFLTASNKAILISSVDHHITNCNFIKNPRAIEINIAQNISFSYLVFSGNDYVALNSSGSPITVQHANCEADNWNYDPAGSTVTFQASVTLTVRHVKTGSEPTEYVRCSIHKKADMSEIMNLEATTADEQYSGYYKATMTYTATGIAVIVRAREKGYLPFETEGTITSGGLDVTAVWLIDPNYQP